MAGRNFVLIFILSCDCFLSVTGLTCNGMAEFCDLKIPQVTFAGTHNSGAGFDGLLYYHTPVGPIAALSCFYRNQGKSITQQLDNGIRYLDIDTCWEESRGWEKGVWSCHEAAYGGPVSKILNQVDAWMNSHPNEVVVMHFNRDTVNEDAGKIGADIVEQVHRRWGPTPERRAAKELMLNDDRRKHWSWPTLGQAIESNKRIFLFLDNKLIGSERALYYRNRWIHISNYEIGMSWRSIGLIESKGCSKLVDHIRDACGKSDYFEFMQVDLTLTWGLCVDDIAYFCNRYAEQVTRQCAERRASRAHSTANFISIDWQSHASGVNKLRDVARRQNIRNVKYFLNKDVKGA